MSVVLPMLCCVLDQWYRCTPNKEEMGDDNSRRYLAIKSAYMLMRRRGLDGLRNTIFSAIEGKQTLEPVYLPLGAGLFTDDIRIEAAVRQCLRHAHLPLRVAATFAASYYVAVAEDLACILAECVMLKTGPDLLQRASASALKLRQGPCVKCLGRTDDSWVPLR